MTGLLPTEWVRERVVEAVREPFTHGAPPLEHTLSYPGDPGLFGPDSVTWQVMGRASTFIGGIRGLLVQACHPEVVAGVDDHSRYREDPLGRLTRTAHYVTTTAFGAMPEVHEAVAFVQRRHAPVTGSSHRGRAYDAADPELAAWVHNALTHSFLVAHQSYSRHRLTPADADRFVVEQTRVGALLGADPMPATAAELADWIATHPAVGTSPGLRAAADFLADPPLGRGQRVGYGLLYRAAVATLPERIADALDVQPRAADATIGVVSARTLEAALGDSPAWRVALERVGAPYPDSATFRR